MYHIDDVIGEVTHIGFTQSMINCRLNSWETPRETNESTWLPENHLSTSIMLNKL